MPSTGGEPKQLTFYPARGPLHAALGLRQPGLRLVDRRHPRPVPVASRRLDAAADAALHGGRHRRPGRCRCRCRSPAPAPTRPDGRQVVYSPRFRDFRSEKRYGGGQANDLFIFDLASHDATRITDHPRADRDPMWIGDTIYFNSDRSGTFNLYAYDVAKKTTTPVTSSTHLGRPLAERGRAGRPHRLRVERRAAAARRRRAARRPPWPSRCPTTAWRGARAASRSAPRSATPS